MKICFATNNKNKLAEIQSLVPHGIELIGLKELGVDEDIPETGATIEENSKQKAEYIYSRFGHAVFADDTGLEVEALQGKPGVLSARYAGDQKNDQDNMELLLTRLSDKPNRQARFKTVITFIAESGAVEQFQGLANGQIIQEKRGSNGFGYDPIFVPDEYDQTFAELSMEVKNKISHRARAFKSFIDYLAAP